MAETKTKTEPFYVTNVAARLIIIAGLNIEPGKCVEIPEHHIEGVKKSSPFKGRMLVAGKKEVREEIIQIQKLELEQALKLISNEKSFDMLSAWTEYDSRKEVLDAIAARLKAL